MAVAKMYGKAIGKMASGSINWTGATVKAALLTSTYTPNQDTHEFVSDLVLASNQATGTGYTAGGVTLTGKTSTYDAGTNTHSLGCATISLTGATVTFRYVVFYVDTGSPTTSPLLGWVDYVTNQAPVAQNVNFVVPAGGLFQFTVAS